MMFQVPVIMSGTTALSRLGDKLGTILPMTGRGVPSGAYYVVEVSYTTLWWKRSNRNLEIPLLTPRDIDEALGL